MDEETKNQFEELHRLLEKTYVSAEKTRRYLLLSLIFSLILFIAPLIVFLIVLPHFIDVLTSSV